MPTKNDILKKLNELSRTHGDRESQPFFAWKQACQTTLFVIDKKLKTDFRERFDSIIYEPSKDISPSEDFRGYSDEIAIAQQRANDAHWRGVWQGQGILFSATEWVEKYWDEDSQGDDRHSEDIKIEQRIFSTDKYQIMRYYLRFLHPNIRTHCAQLFLDGHYPQAIEESVKSVFGYIREKTGLTCDGSTLADQVFTPNNPILKFNALSSSTDKNEQLGFMELLKAYFKSVRNVLAHLHGQEEDEQKTFEYLVLASLLCRRVDDAVKYTNP